MEQEYLLKKIKEYLFRSLDGPNDNDVAVIGGRVNLYYGSMRENHFSFSCDTDFNPPVIPANPPVEELPELKGEEIEAGDEDASCNVCLENKPRVCLIPCGHFVLCFGCYKSIKDTTKICPMCRGEIKNAVVVHQ